VRRAKARGARSAARIVSTHALPRAGRRELSEGIGHRFSAFVYLFGDDGIEMASIAERELVRGTTGFAGEIGHTVVNPGGDLCVCGDRGCLNTVASTRAILDSAGIEGDRIEGLQTLIRRAHDAEPRAITALQRASAAIANVATPICSALGPEAFILGGDLAQISEWLIGELDEAFASRTLAGKWSRCGVLAGRVNDQASARGGAGLVQHQIHDDPTIVPRRSERPGKVAQHQATVDVLDRTGS
jgi:predicted NBD/HSP70 family sugar kinase